MQLTVILAVFIALLLEECWLTYTEFTEAAFPGWLQGGAVLALAAGVAVLLWSMYRFWSNRVLDYLRAGAEISQINFRLPQRVEALGRSLNVLVFALLLTMGGWSRLIYHEWQLQRLILLDEIALIGPYLIFLFIQWHTFYPLNRFLREYVVPGQLAEGLAARPVWSRGQFILFQFRHHVLIILVPLLSMLGFKDLVEKITVYGWMGPEGTLPTAVSAVSQGVILAGCGVIFFLAPFLIRHVWLTRPLPAGPLRTRLEAFCQRLRMGYRNILLWDTYGCVANAAVMGLVGRVRYVLLSDNIIENMPDEHIEAVFGHEAGHIKYHHIFFLVMFVVGSGQVILLGIELAAQGLQQLGFEFHVNFLHLSILTLTGLGIMLGWIILFGVISRNFERQSDVYAARIIGRQSGGMHLDSYGAYVMGQALHRVAVLNGIAIEARSFRHSSILSRMELLRKLSQESGALERFDRKLRWMKLLIVLCFTVGIAGWAILFSLA